MVIAASSPWGLAAASLWLGLVARSVAQHWIDRGLGRRGHVPFPLIHARILLLRLRHTFPTAFGFVDPARELAIVDREISAPGIGFPHLPTVDPAHADLPKTMFYLRQARCYLWKRRLADGRKILPAVVAATAS